MSKTPQGSYSRQGAPNYPTQQPAYPTHPQPMQYSGGYAPHPQPGTQFSYGTGQYGFPPPPYRETPPVVPPSSGYSIPGLIPRPPAQTSSALPSEPGTVSVTTQQVPQQYPSMAPSGQYPTQPYPVGQYLAQAPPPHVIQGSFDPGARFNSGATVNIPPPPPGYAPNAAQAASSQGQSVNVQQRQATWFSGGTDGGYTFW